MADLILTMLREAKGPMTGRQLHEESIRRGVQPTSQDPIQAMENRLQQLRNKGIVKRASGQPGFVLISSTSGAHQEPARPSPSGQTSTPKAATEPARAKPAARKREKRASPSAGTATTPKPGRGGQPPLREVLTEILKKSRKPQFGSALAAQVLAAGYQTNSQNFTNTVTALLTNMDGVEHVAGQGYRLKRKA